MTTDYHEYYNVLGVRHSASNSEIKTAFRKKAKQLHPDINKSPDAGDQFMMLMEAYEYLSNARSGKPKTKLSQDETWNENIREAARAKARHHARMKYKEYINSDHYKSTQAVLTVVHHLYLLSCVVILVGAPIAGFIYKGLLGLGIGFVVVFFTVNYWSGLFTDKLNIDLKAFIKSGKMILRSRLFRLILFSVINVFLLFRFTLNTDFSTVGLVCLLLGLEIIGFAVLKLSTKWKRHISGLFVMICLIPGLYNLFFLVNYSTASDPVYETYSFTHEWSWYPNDYYGLHLFSNSNQGEYRKVGYINIQGNMYHNRHWFRMFFDFDSMENRNSITYTFEKGIFGLRVLKDSKFK